MSMKKWLFSLLALLLLTLIVFGGTMYLLDPLLQYGKESGPLTSYEYAEMYSNPGIAQHYTYDAVLVGTSMIENTDIDEFDALMGTDAVRLPYSGGTARNMKTILDVCFLSDNSIKAVYWELDEFQLFSNAGETRYPLPSYLYRNDVKEDLSYLLNLDIFYHYGMKDILGTLRGDVQPAERRGESFQGSFGKDAVLSSYSRAQQRSAEISQNTLIRLARANLDENILPLIESHPDTQFVFYFVPFSILYWDQEMRSGKFDFTMNALEYAVEQLLQYDNVTIFFYHDEEETITNLDNYKDYSHYGKWINSDLTQAMASGKGRLTAENYRQTLDRFRQFIHSYDFDSLFG